MGQQTEIKAPEAKRDYSKGLDSVLQREQLLDCLKSMPNGVRLRKKQSNKGERGTPLFGGANEEQQSLF